MPNLLVSRLTIFNFLAMCGMIYMWQLGFIQDAIDNDPTYLVEGTFVIYLLSLASTYYRAFEVSRLWNKIKNFNTVKLNPTSFLVKQGHLDDAPAIIASMGLLGTLIGVVYGIKGLTLDDTKAIMDGIQTAGWTTMTSIVLFVLAMINKRMLFTSSVLLLEEIKDKENV